MTRLHFILFITSLLFSSCHYVDDLLDNIPYIGAESRTSDKIDNTEDDYNYIDSAIFELEADAELPAEEGTYEAEDMDGRWRSMTDMGSPDNSWDLHNSLKSYESNIFESETDNFRIRIDYLGGEDGYEKEYRYAAWRVNYSHNEEPALVLYSTDRDLEEYNTIYEFQNGLYRYICTMQSQFQPFELVVYKGNQELRREVFTIP